MLFFFQAEDGIRDRTVTGVQTCALPISPSAALRILIVDDQAINQKLLVHLLGREGHLTRTADNGREAVDLLEREPFDRSEERRVGKECRSRWWPYANKRDRASGTRDRKE